MGFTGTVCSVSVGYEFEPDVRFKILLGLSFEFLGLDFRFIFFLSLRWV